MRGSAPHGGLNRFGPRGVLHRSQSPAHQDESLTSVPTNVHSGATVPAFPASSLLGAYDSLRYDYSNLEGAPVNVTYDYLTDAAQIYDESFGTIRREADLSRFPEDVSKVVVRMIHAAAQTDLPADIAFTPGIVASAREALWKGAPIFCDSSMVATGIIRSRLPKQNEVVCYLGDPRLAEMAAELGTTKTAAAVDLWLPRLEGAVVAIGNAPTALFRLLEVVRDTGVKPAGVIGIPVGFVGAAESKQALVDNPFGLEYLALLGRRGGSAITVAAVNAIASTDERTNTIKA